jgi:hypothetical protein
MDDFVHLEQNVSFGLDQKLLQQRLEAKASNKTKQ